MKSDKNKKDRNVRHAILAPTVQAQLVQLTQYC